MDRRDTGLCAASQDLGERLLVVVVNCLLTAVLLVPLHLAPALAWGWPPRRFVLDAISVGLSYGLLAGVALAWRPRWATAAGWVAGLLCIARVHLRLHHQPAGLDAITTYAYVTVVLCTALAPWLLRRRWLTPAQPQSAPRLQRGGA